MKKLTALHISIVLWFLSGLMFPIPVQAAPAPRQAPPLFTDATPPDGDITAAAVENDPGVLRTRFVNIHLEALDAFTTSSDLSAQANEPLQIELFPDTQVSAEITAREDSITGGIVLSGNIVGGDGGFVTLSIQDDILSAAILVGTASYDVHYLQDNVYLIRQFDSGSAPPDSPDMLPPDIVSSDVTAQYGGDDSADEIDVMVVYTTNARVTDGGASTILGDINSAISNTNLAYRNSGINQRMVLVHTEEVSYDDSVGTWGSILNDLTYTNDSQINQIHTLRDTYGADLVVMVINRSEYCGMGWLLDNPTNTGFDGYAFSLVSYSYYCLPQYTLAHETGHNMGAHHDRANAGMNPRPAYDYSFGYQGFSGSTCKFYTVMAYANGCSSGSRVPYFSNPNVNYLGIPTGVDQSKVNSADNHLTLNNTAAMVAKFRDGIIIAPSNLTVTANVSNYLTLNWTDNSNNETGFSIQRLGSTGWAEIDSVSANTTTYANTGLTCLNSYTYRIIAYGPNGTSSASNEASNTACTVNPPANLAGTAAAFNSSYPTRRTINLTWQDTNTGETSYSIERSLSGVYNYSVIATLGANTTSYADSTVACGTTYTYRARALGSIYSTYSNIATITSLMCPPLQPTGLTAAKRSQIRINLSWTDPSNSTSNNEDYFRIERKTGSGAWTFVANVGSGVTSYSDASLACGTTYSYQVRSSNAVGDSAWSAAATETTYACNTAPQPPITISTESMSINALQITWENVDVETGYRVERSITGTGSWTEIANLGADVTSFYDSLLHWDTSYYYRVRAYNANGNSAYSSVASGKTFANGIFFP